MMMELLVAEYPEFTILCILYDKNGMINDHLDVGCPGFPHFFCTC